MITTNFFLLPLKNDPKNGGSPNDRAAEDWRSYAVASAIALSGGFREASKRMVKQAKEKLNQVPASAYRVVALNICDMIVATDRRRFERAALLKQTANDGLRSISGSEAVELKDVLEQVCIHLELKS
ncbi:MAG: hypothetical protein K2Y39_01250 [Candidatus Obscuribacterales bacterium]|nr:hypothetical protein [Candidatus Obscuribacterales bacterium]